jgi:exonuclease III
MDIQPISILTYNKRSDILQLYQQNIRGLHNKTEELTTQWTTHSPHILCFTEHHLKEFEIINTHITNYSLGPSYCRHSRTHGRVGIFVHNTLAYSTINLNNICNNNDYEACAVKLDISPNTYHILCIYRPPAGNFSTFLLHLETVLMQLNSNTTNLIICGDININYLQDSRNKSLLNSLLDSYNLHSAVTFPTRISNNSSTSIDNIFIDKTKNADYSIIPISNGLSDHDAQVILLHNTDIPTQQVKHVSMRRINETTLAQFKLNLSYESWYSTMYSITRILIPVLIPSLTPI